MSSYFDEAARLYSQAGSPEQKAEVISKVVERMKGYIAYIYMYCQSGERVKLKGAQDHFGKICGKVFETGLEYMRLEKLHDLGHNIRQARITLHGRGIAGDNPYYPNHYDMGLGPSCNNCGGKMEEECLRSEASNG